MPRPPVGAVCIPFDDAIWVLLLRDTSDRVMTSHARATRNLAVHMFFTVIINTAWDRYRWPLSLQQLNRSTPKLQVERVRNWTQGVRDNTQLMRRLHADTTFHNNRREYTNRSAPHAMTAAAAALWGAVVRVAGAAERCGGALRRCGAQGSGRAAPAGGARRPAARRPAAHRSPALRGRTEAVRWRARRAPCAARRGARRPAPLAAPTAATGWASESTRLQVLRYSTKAILHSKVKETNALKWVTMQLTGSGARAVIARAADSCRPIDRFLFALLYCKILHVQFTSIKYTFRLLF